MSLNRQKVQKVQEMRLVEKNLGGINCIKAGLKSSARGPKEKTEEASKLKDVKIDGERADLSALQNITCPYCTKKFSRKYTLARHVLIHKGVKAFPCDFCSKRFTQKVDATGMNAVV